MGLLEIDNLSIDFTVDGRWLPAVSGVSFSVERGEIISLVGESGCGKSVTCLSLGRLLPEPPARYSSGKILLDGKSVLDLNPRALRALRRKTISYIFQEPSSSLNPVFRIGAQIAEAVQLRVDSEKETDVAGEVLELLDQVGIPDPASAAKRYPHELSGGMQQRVMIAMALAGKPDILVADEPTTALDVTIQAQILELLARVNRETGMAIILVTHNLGIVADMANRVVVMYAGRAVEATETKRLLATPAHPYTRALLSAVPKLGHSRETLPTIPGNVPSPADFPSGCRFHGRCQEELALQENSICSTNVPEWREIEKGHYAACHCLK